MRIREFFMDVEMNATQSLSEELEQAKSRIAEISHTCPDDVVVKQIIPSGEQRYTVMLIATIWDQQQGALV
ncbi:hypothetical protein [Paenibacillus turpanensis]|uniref:hypothetical protein n=1 Tax=Paenibacillus turpanensis TaxID=2689078 RepID=UPI00140DEE72|nr:hypothetical protein [Paenibacillus turpanensis]